MSSSIFSFENFRRYAALPRCERHWHAVLAGFTALLALLCYLTPVFFFGANGCTGATLGSAAVASLSDKTQVLFVGSSHVLFGIRPQQYSMPAMNLAATWMDYTCARRVLEKHLSRVPNVKVVVIEYDELPLISDLVPSLVGAGDLRPLTELGLAPSEIPTANVRQRMDVFYTALIFPLATLPRLTPTGWTNRAECCSTLQQPPEGVAAGYFLTKLVTPPTYNPQILFNVLDYSARNEKIVQRNLQALRQTIELLRRRGVTVVLLRLPHGRGYARQRPPSVQARWQQLQNEALAQNRTDNRILVWDWGERPEFQRTDFSDDNHLNVYGANKLARLLDGQLQLLCHATL